MGKALAKINAAWQEHVAQVGDAADYGSFLAGWMGAEDMASEESQETETQGFKVGARIMVHENTHAAPVGPGTITEEPYEEEQGLRWWVFTSDEHGSHWYAADGDFTALKEDN